MPTSLNLSPYYEGWLVIADLDDPKPVLAKHEAVLERLQIYEITEVFVSVNLNLHPHAYRLKGFDKLVQHQRLTPLQGKDPVYQMGSGPRVDDLVCLTKDEGKVVKGVHRVVGLHWGQDSRVWLMIQDGKGVTPASHVIPLSPSDEEGTIGLEYLMEAYNDTQALIEQHTSKHPLYIELCALRHNIRGAIQELASS